MADRPFILIRPAAEGRRGRLGGGGSAPRRLSIDQQRPRILPRFQELEDYLARRQAAPLRASAAGASPEEVLVFEVAGSVDRFVQAVARTPDLEWLVESDEFQFPDDPEFGAGDPEEGYPGRLYFVMANHRAIEQLRALWTTWEVSQREGTQWPTGLTPWRDVFSQLRDIRPWGARDRLLETGLVEILNDDIAAGVDNYSVEIELWFRPDGPRRAESEAEVRRAVVALNGDVIRSTQITEIQYHGMLVTLPAEAVRDIVIERETGLHQRSEVMFLRPTGQFAAPITGPVEALPAVGRDAAAADPVAPPRVAIFDGLPVENHSLLLGRLLVDDPDGWAETYPASERRHGTSMASLVSHGDLASRQSPLLTRIYVRPILRPNPRTLDFNTNLRWETFPDDELDVDVVHRAVVRMMGTEDVRGEADSVRIINLSVGNPYQLFDHLISPMARLLDWLSHKYNILFIVSAGNHTRQIDLGWPRDQMAAVGDEELNARILEAIWSDARNRRLLSPAESMNALTVASTHADATADVLPGEVGFFREDGLPSPINALGFGHRKSIKPDLLSTGGRNPYRLAVARPEAVLESVQTTRAPGVRHAYPGAQGDLTATAYTRGTSNAAALTSNTAGHVYRLLEEMRVPDAHRTALTKALLVHGCAWPPSRNDIAQALAFDAEQRSKELTRFFGYGALAPTRVLSAADERATLVGWGDLDAEQGQTFEIPLPASLSGRRDWRRLTVTLGWLSPINHAHRKYRRAQLWFEMLDSSHDVVQVHRANAQWQLVRKGTVQHEVFEGDRSAVFGADRRIRIRVNSKGDAGSYAGAVSYGLAVTLEVAPELQLPLYDEIRAQLPIPIQVAP